VPERLYRVEGRVQGVGYRWWTRTTARRLGLAGTVRNLPDGGVEVRALGSEEALERLRRELAAGPAGADVSRVHEEPTSDVPATSFDILR
jgi:acylphosphatase